MCRCGTAMAATESAVVREDERTLYMIGAALQFVASLEEEAERVDMSLNEYVRWVRNEYLSAQRQARSS